MNRKYYKIQFHGSLAEEFGSSVQPCYALHLQDAVEALVAKFGDRFRSVILNGAWHIVAGKLEDENYLSEKLVNFSIKADELHFIPAVQGSGGSRGGGIGEIILGIVLVAVAVVTMNPELVGADGALIGGAAGTAVAGMSSSLMVAGAMSMLGGIMSLIVPVPKMNYGVAQRQSFIFNGVVNNTQQGVCVPLIYGEHLTGSTTISADIQTSNVNWNMLTAQQVLDGVQY